MTKCRGVGPVAVTRQHSVYDLPPEAIAPRTGKVTAVTRVAPAGSSGPIGFRAAEGGSGQPGGQLEHQPRTARSEGIGRHAATQACCGAAEAVDQIGIDLLGGTAETGDPQRRLRPAILDLEHDCGAVAGAGPDQGHGGLDGLKEGIS